MEGPYRDLGAGFARLSGVEGLRRSPGRLRSVEDALFEVLRNSRDAGARNVYVASSLGARRYRHLVVIDDGRGIPETHKHLVFEPGVTTRHLNPVPEAPVQERPRTHAPHGAGLSLYHVKNVSLSAEVLSASSPTAIKVVFDTFSLPEKRLQSNARPSKTNLPATLTRFLVEYGPNPPRLYHASPSRILSRLLSHRIIQTSQGNQGSRGNDGRGNDGETTRVREAALGLGLEVSLRTVQRILAGGISAAGEVRVEGVSEGRSEGRGVVGGASEKPSVTGRDDPGGPILSVGAEELAEIRTVLGRAAGSSYLELAGLDVEARPGEVILRARVYEREDEYE